MSWRENCATDLRKTWRMRVEWENFEGDSLGAKCGSALSTVAIKKFTLIFWEYDQVDLNW